MNNDYADLRSLDLNLLVVFAALMETRHVGRAAERCALSQPAMSNALARLRAALGDPLLVRTPAGMSPSPRALALDGPIRVLLDQLERHLRPPAPFDPASTRRVFRLCLTDYGENVVLPHLTQVFRDAAPRARLETVPLTSTLPEQALERGSLDVVVAVQKYFETPARLNAQPWLQDRFVCLGHPDVYRMRSMGLEAFLRRRHIYPSPLGVQANVVDDWLTAQGRQRDIAVTTQSYLVAARLAAASDLLLSVPGRVAQHLAAVLRLRQITPPRGFPEYRLCLIWHPLHAADPALTWLLDRLRDLEPPASGA